MKINVSADNMSVYTKARKHPHQLIDQYVDDTLKKISVVL